MEPKRRFLVILHDLYPAFLGAMEPMLMTDCLPAIWTVNKGRCKEESGLIRLEEIFELCDQQRVQLIALWVPREDNFIYLLL